MRWDADAERALARAPALLRSFVRRKVEDFAKSVGAEYVTADLVRRARAEIGSGGKTGDAARPEPGLIEQLESRLVAEQGEKRRTRTYHVGVCAGAVGCPRSLVPVEAVADALAEEIEASGFPEHLAEGREGRPILSHHRFRVAVAGCPNACSQPHICDFGVIGQAAPTLTPERCTACGDCLSACREEAVLLRGDLPVIDAQRCIACGDCVRACQTRALESGRSGFRSMVGGKLGRHPRLAADLLTSAGEQAVRDLLAAVLSVLMRRGEPGERLGSLIARDESVEAALRSCDPRFTREQPSEEAGA